MVDTFVSTIFLLFYRVAVLKEPRRTIFYWHMRNAFSASWKVSICSLSL